MKRTLVLLAQWGRCFVILVVELSQRDDHQKQCMEPSGSKFRLYNSDFMYLTGRLWAILLLVLCTNRFPWLQTWSRGEPWGVPYHYSKEAFSLDIPFVSRRGYWGDRSTKGSSKYFLQLCSGEQLSLWPWPLCGKILLYPKASHWKFRNRREYGV